MSFAPYQKVYTCGSDGPGATNLLYWLDRESPWAKLGTNYGVCNCRGTGGGSLSQHSRCRAFDFGLPMVNGRANPIGNAVVANLAAQGLRLGLTELIWNRRRYHAGAPAGEYYDGVSPHYDHIHGALTLNGTRYLNVPTIRMVMSGITAAEKPIDWKALRRWIAGDLYNKVLPMPVMWLNNIRDPRDVVALRQALNLVLNENLIADGAYDADQDWQVQRFQHNVESFLGGNPIPENRGTFADATKVYLAQALANIRDGRTP